MCACVVCFTRPFLQIQPSSPARVLQVECAVRFFFFFFFFSPKLLSFAQKKNSAESLKMSRRSLKRHACFKAALLLFSNSFLFFVFIFFPLSLSLFLQFRRQAGRLDFTSHQEHQAVRLGQKSNVASRTCKSACFFFGFLGFFCSRT